MLFYLEQTDFQLHVYSLTLSNNLQQKCHCKLALKLRMLSLIFSKNNHTLT